MIGKYCDLLTRVTDRLETCPYNRLSGILAKDRLKLHLRSGEARLASSCLEISTIWILTNLCSLQQGLLICENIIVFNIVVVHSIQCFVGGCCMRGVHQDFRNGMKWCVGKANSGLLM
jgi:hypothetical protein